jgi:hypothetical protein
VRLGFGGEFRVVVAQRVGPLMAHPGRVDLKRSLPGDAVGP